MDVKAARQVQGRFNRSVLHQTGQPYGKKVCKYWLAGMCNRQPCAFLHDDMPHSQPKKQSTQLCREYSNHIGHKIKRNVNQIYSENVPTANVIKKNTWKNPGPISCKHTTSEVDREQCKPKKIHATNPSNGAVGSNVQRYPGIVKNIHATVTSNGVVGTDVDSSGLLSSKAVSSTSATKGGTQFETEHNVHNHQSKLCKYWVSGNCGHGDMCKDLHSWFCGLGFSMMTILEGHTKAVSGVVLPIGSDKLFSTSKDETLRVWDCHSGQCVNNVKVEGEIQCLLSEGSWLFAGLKNAVKAWNFQTQTEHVLSGPNGLVHALAASDDMLFAGVQGGSILVWKSNFGPDCPESVTTLKVDNLTVLTLVVGAKKLYSGSKDSTICVWDLETLQCVEILTGHTDFVTSLLCWDCYLLSGSLDNSVKVWSTSDSGKLEVVYEVKEESGVITLRGIMDAEDKPILLCSYKDGTVRLYDLPTFVERGRIFAKREIQSIETGWCGGLFFTGDATGQLAVWKLDGEFKATSS